jgi:preprotein translocase subunit SecB
MTDAAPDAASNGADPAAGPAIRVLAQFIRDLSFENPRAPDALAGPGQPQFELGIELNARGRQDGLFEVDLKLNINATREGAALFQLELLYGGLFQIGGVPEADLEPVLLIECPRFLFPFVRRLISDLTADGGFAPLLLDPMDFAAVYASRKAAEASPVGNA